MKKKGNNSPPNLEDPSNEDALSFDNLQIKNVDSDEKTNSGRLVAKIKDKIFNNSRSTLSENGKKAVGTEEMEKLHIQVKELNLQKTSNFGTRNTSFRNTDISMRKNFDQNVNISGIKKNFSYDITNRTMDTLKPFNQSDEKDIKRRVRKLSQEILDMNRKDIKETLKRKKSDADAKDLENIDLSSNLSSDLKVQKLIKLNSSFKSNNHRDFLVKINMIGDLNSGKTEFVSIVTDSKQPSRNKTEAKKGIQGKNQRLSKKE